MLPKAFKKSIKRWIYSYLPKSDWLYTLASQYTNFYFNQSHEMEFNGEAYLLQYLKKQNYPLKRCFDVGANVGNWGAYFHALFPNCALDSFEPSLKAFRKLTQRFQTSQFQNNQLIVSDSSGELDFFVFSEGSEINSVYQTEQGNVAQRIERIASITLSDYCASHAISQVDYLKIDVERHEMAVLRGAEPLLQAQAISMIQFEFSRTNAESRHFFKDIFLLLTQNGYRVSRIHPRGLMPIAEYSEFLEHNFANYFAYLPKVESVLPLTKKR